ncbi:MAG TPA: hypothetical protein VED01_00835 [Burkholderiales bacterium]|nr:hypothetical protein [Burkholderiales bacterium]
MRQFPVTDAATMKPGPEVLRELAHVRQIKGGRRRRWFQSHDEDLIVWYADDGSLYGFQLCYGRNRTERALTWTVERGFSHNKVDAGDRRGIKYARTPILVPDGTFDARAMAQRFAEVSISVPSEVRDFVLSKIRDYPVTTG